MATKLFLLVMVLVSLTASCYAEVAKTPLTQKISRVLNSDEYCISFKFDGEVIDTVSNNKVTYYFVETFAQKGNDVVEITNPVAGEVEKIMEDAMKAEPVLAKGTVILEIDKFTDKADAELFTVPENYRVPSDDELNKFVANTVQIIN